MFCLLLLTLSQAEPNPPITLSVTPTSPPRPALKYELLPTARERQPGNAALGYLQAIIARPTLSKNPKVAQTWLEQDEQFRSKAIELVSGRELTEHLKPFSGMFRLIDQASRYQTCDWQRQGQLSGEGLLTSLPELQQHRELAKLLELRIRLALIEGHDDQAIDHLKTALQHGKQLAEGPSLVQMLVGVNILNQQIRQLEDFISRPKSPNLLNALNQLPSPLVDPSFALNGEELFLESCLPGLKAFEKGPITADQAVDAIEALIQSLPATEQSTNWKSLTTKVGIIGYAALYLDEAKAELNKNSRIDLKGMPSSQVVLLRAIHVYREVIDEIRSNFQNPQLDSQAFKKRKDSKDPLIAALLQTVPSIEKVREQWLIIEQRLDLLRTIETLRASGTKIDWQKLQEESARKGMPIEKLNDRKLKIQTRYGKNYLITINP